MNGNLRVPAAILGVSSVRVVTTVEYFLVD